MIVVDASVWVSLLVPQDSHHTVSRHWLGQQMTDGETVVAPVLLLVEVAGALARRTGRTDLGHRAVTQLLDIPALRLVPVDGRLGVAAARLAADLRLRGADATYVAVAHHLTIPLVTWDGEHLERAGERIAVRTPSADETPSP